MNKILTIFLMILIGVANGQSILTIRQVYGYNVGDVFEYKINQALFGPIDTAGYRNTIVERKDSKNSDSITYKIRVDSYKFSTKNSRRTYTFNSRVIDKSYTDLDSNISKPFRHQWDQMVYFTDTIYFDTIQDGNVYYYSTSDGCNWFSEIIGKGIGLVEYYSSGFGGLYLENLSYYKRGNVQFGTQDKNYELALKSLTFSKNLLFYPNPVISKLNFSQPLYPNYRILIIDNTGRIVMNITNLDSEYEIDVSHISKGLYFLVIENTGQKFIKKFTKE